MIYIISQIIGIIAFSISLIAYHKDKKEKILSNMIISNLLNLIHYLLIGATSGYITKALAIIRDTLIISKNNNKKLNKSIILYILIVVYILVGLITFKNIWSLFPIIAALIYLIPIWNGDKKIVKKTAAFCYLLWLIYNIFVLSLAGIISNTVSIISTIIAVINENKRTNN